MKWNNRKRFKKAKPVDPVEAFLASSLQPGDGWTAFYCKDHGKQLVRMEAGDLRPTCNECGNQMITESERSSIYDDLREQRRKRVSLLRNFLER